MTTGDLHNNLRKLLRELKTVRYPRMSQLDLRGLASGIPAASLPILHYVFLDFSCELSQFFADKDYELYGKTDLRFVETVYKILRDEFHYKPPLTKEQFLAIGFAERKIIQLYELLKKCRQKHAELNPKAVKEKKKLESSKKRPSKESKLAPNASKENHSDYHPLPVNTEMKFYKDNQDAVRAGGFSEPLVTRVMPSAVKTYGNCTDEDKENLGMNAQVLHGDMGMISGKLVQRANGNSSSNSPTTLASTFHPLPQPKLQGQIPKSVRFEDGYLADSFNSSTIVSGEYVNRPNMFTRSGYPGMMKTSYTACLPAPVAMTTAPKPSPDLMLTPMGKLQHESIPLSASRGDYHNKGSDVSLLDLTDSNNMTQPKIVRHTLEIAGESCRDTNTLVNNPPRDPHSNDEVSSIRSQLQEMEEKFNTILSQNNEMSARIVLLESKMKMVEEGMEKKTCFNCNCSENDKSVKINFVSNTSHNSQPKLTYLSADGDKRGTSLLRSDGSRQESPTSRRLFTEFDPSSNELLSRYTGSSGREGNTNSIQQRMGSTESRYLLSPVSKASGHDTSGSTDSMGSPVGSPSQPRVTPASPKAYSVSAMGSPNQPMGFAASPMGSPARVAPGVGNTPDIHLTFADPSTKATVMNVHRRLKETREMLARTNQNYAAKFTHI